MPIIMCGDGACTTDVKNSFRGCANPIETWAGCVLSKHERNGYDDSDFYALVWDEADQQVVSVEYASTRGWTYHNGAVIDASPEIIAKAAVYTAHRRAEIQAEVDAINARLPAVGKVVRSLTTRGKNKGVVGLVRRVYDGAHGRTVAVEVEGEGRYRHIACNRVEVVHPEMIHATS